jgi:hypothetical protein
MHKLMLAAVGACLLSATAMAQTPTFPAEAASLTWMEGARFTRTTAPCGGFIGPVNGVVTGTALTVLATGGAYTEYHKIGPNAEGVYGLDVANTRNGMKWTFTPLKAIEPGRITLDPGRPRYFSDMQALRTG